MQKTEKSYSITLINSWLANFHIELYAKTKMSKYNIEWKGKWCRGMGCGHEHCEWFSKVGKGATTKEKSETMASFW